MICYRCGQPYQDGACGCDDGITLIHGDCRDVLGELPDGSVDLVLTDPPYGVGYSTGRRSVCTRSSTRLAYDLATAPLLNDTADALAPLLNDTAVIYWFAAPERLDVMMPIVRGLGDVPNVLCWDKGNCTAGDLETTYGQQWEAIIYARRTRTPLLGGRDRDVLRFSRGATAAYLHPTQKPLPLLRYLLSRHPSGTVLDMFAGSGTTGRAAKDLGRRCLMVELEERYVEIAARRLEQAVLPLEQPA